MDFPRLIENGVGSYMHDALQVCHSNRIRIYSIALNVGILIIFALVVIITLYCCYKQKPTPYEAHQKMMRDQEYVLSKIKYYQAEQKNIMRSPIGTAGDRYS